MIKIIVEYGNFANEKDILYLEPRVDIVQTNLLRLIGMIEKLKHETDTVEKHKLRLRCLKSFEQIEDQYMEQHL